MMQHKYVDIQVQHFYFSMGHNYVNIHRLKPSTHDQQWERILHFGQQWERILHFGRDLL